MRRATGLFAILLLILLTIFVAGCSSRAPQSPSRGASLTMRIHWPTATRLIPATARSITVTISVGTFYTSARTVNRVPGNPVSTVTFVGVPEGSVTITITAFPEYDGAGIPQSTGTRKLSVLPGEQIEFAVTLDSTITQVVPSLEAQALALNRTLTLTVTTMNDQGEIVLVDQNAVVWTSSNPAIAAVDANTGQVTALNIGTATITGRETGSRLTCTVTITVVDVAVPGVAVGEIKTNPVDVNAMVWVPASSFLMGSPDAEGNADEHPQHTVTLDGFWIYKYEVTVGQYRAFCLATGTPFPATAPPWGWHDDQPMVNVSWTDAAAFAYWVGGRLPSEAEWQLAARGTGSLRYPWGDVWDVEKCNNYNDTNVAGGGAGALRPAPDGSYTGDASPYGVMDMAGNVREWCMDWYSANYYTSSPTSNPSGAVTGTERVITGGSFSGSASELFRGASRGSALPTSTSVECGFRCVIAPPGNPTNDYWESTVTIE